MTSVKGFEMGGESRGGDGKPAVPGQDVVPDDQTAGSDAEAESGAENDDWLNASLTGYYDELLNEPMPPSIAELLKKLEKKEIKK